MRLLCAPGAFQREEVQEVLLRCGAQVEQVGVCRVDVRGERMGLGEVREERGGGE